MNMAVDNEYLPVRNNSSFCYMVGTKLFKAGFYSIDDAFKGAIKDLKLVAGDSVTIGHHSCFPLSRYISFSDIEENTVDAIGSDESFKTLEMERADWNDLEAALKKTVDDWAYRNRKHPHFGTIQKLEVRNV